MWSHSVVGVVANVLVRQNGGLGDNACDTNLVSSFVWHRLLSVEHLNKNGRPALYLVFEYVDTDLRKFIDLSFPAGPDNPLPPLTIRVSKPSLPHYLQGEVEGSQCRLSLQICLHLVFVFTVLHIVRSFPVGQPQFQLKAHSSPCLLNGCRTSCINC